ncbi:heterokaryon incompatibility protein-domain-containing protein [Xylariaceae sp. AK1471]|nr:heterokaryon incompatibility protein-domain-containing protein [Xylariaceae sp. AK1471]
MRLINTLTLDVQDFFGSSIPEFAILSHTWGSEEVTYQQWIARNNSKGSLAHKNSYQKIKGAYQQAYEDGLHWLWIDTICIDKTSSAELTEAINSMFKWYMDSKICYAYLADVAAADLSDRDTSFCASLWFTRGWTLQELLAPRDLVFYSREWLPIGSRSDPRLLSAISRTTRIETMYLTGHKSLKMASVAKRMSWLSKRQTTREEDIAYCMLGIFGVNMPLLYGEGPRAFLRLQEEIVKVSYDHSLFCWTFTAKVPRDWVSILAPSPGAFEKSADYIPKELHEDLAPYTITNLGLSIQLPIVHSLTHSFIILNAGLSQQAMNERAGLAVRHDLSSTSAFGSTLRLSRHWFPSEPINISWSEPYAMYHHQFFISSRSDTLLSDPYAQPLLEDLSILVLMQTTQPRLFEGAKPIGFEQRVHSGHNTAYIETPTIETYPPDMFDFQRSVLYLPTLRGGKDHIAACLLVVRHDSEPSSGYFLFFAFKRFAKEEKKWSCDIVPRASLSKRKRSGIWPLGEILTDFIHQTLKSSRKDSLVLTFGPFLTAGRSHITRTVLLQGSGQGPLWHGENRAEEDDSDVDSNCARAG